MLNASAVQRQNAPTLFMRKILALALRHIYLYIGSWPRLIEMMYWPTINILMLGFVSLYVSHENSGQTILPQIFIAGALLSEIIIRVSQGMMILFMEEVWSRNLGHMFASPLGIFNYAFGMMGLSFIRCVIAMTPAIIIAKFLFNYSLITLGLPLFIFFVLLILNGWWFGLLIVSLILRLGLAAEWLTWMCIWILIPITAPYYPVSVLPHALQYVAWLLPGTYVFESMKHLIAHQPLVSHDLFVSLGLNLLYGILSVVIFYRAYLYARRSGRLLQTGE